MTNAAAIATLAELAGAARVVVGVGSGFTGRMTMGQRAMRWRDVAAYVRTLRGLLRGEQVLWEGKPIQMLHTPSFVPTTVGGALHHRRGRPQGHCRRP